ncbi:thioredoxin family protein [Metallumcola ferriviriculae]|uniref:Thioredoxin family protein n=1 Tax=Metallumcola ferriviriculae TaxID=3039180 RepID=A0AAU0UKY8_9FIRM|nr:thioredoxin family protein [Desulfitibacteraceae bacterium MK1]
MAVNKKALIPTVILGLFLLGAIVKLNTIEPVDFTLEASPVYQTLQQAQAEGKPVWLLFHSNTCQSCVEMMEIYNQLKPQYEGKVVFVDALVSDARNNELNKTYGIQYIPTTVLIDGGGKEVTKEVGVITPEKMARFLIDIYEGDM